MDWFLPPPAKARAGVGRSDQLRNSIGLPLRLHPAGRSYVDTARSVQRKPEVVPDEVGEPEADWLSSLEWRVRRPVSLQLTGRS